MVGLDVVLIRTSLHLLSFLSLVFCVFSFQGSFDSNVWAAVHEFVIPNQLLVLCLHHCREYCILQLLLEFLLISCRNIF